MSDTDNINLIFTQRKAGIDCPMCPDEHADDVVAELASGRVHLQNDADYRGYCILICRRHAVEVHDLTEAERKDWIEDTARVCKAISKVCQPGKLNLSMLGNMVPHLHCHFMPRYPTDPEWGHPPAFKSPDQRRLLTAEEYADLHSRLKQALSQT